MRGQTLYRQFNSENVLLYVGITCNTRDRLKNHEKHSNWWLEVNQVTIEHFADRQSVLVAERIAIETEKPKYNIVHNRLKLEKEKPFTALDVTQDNITARLVSIPILATPEKIAEILNLPRRVIRNAMENGTLGHCEIPNSTLTKMLKLSSGWQILDWLESLGATNSISKSRYSNLK